jgi:hypothetical protein
MVDMAVCTYDNPATMHRECWQDGRLLYSYSADLLESKEMERMPAELFFFGANIGRWKTGQLWGDVAALDKPPEGA